MHSVQTGGHDWLARWQAMYDAERQQAEQRAPSSTTRRNDCWSGQASRYATAMRRGTQPDGFMQFVLPLLAPTDTVLDIGAGTGRYEPTLAAHVAHLIALEPSAAMRAHLSDVCAPQANITVMAEGWPAPAPVRADVVLAAHVVYGVRDIGPFLQAMDAAATRLCVVLAAFRHPSSYSSPFWERIYGEPRLPLPAALECVNALYQLGIPANLMAIPTTNPMQFGDVEEALDDVRARLRLAPNPDTDAQLRMAIDELLEPTPTGGLRPRDQHPMMAAIWWKPTNQPQEQP